MDELGKILRDAREMKGLTLAEAQQETRINARFLEALEQANYDMLPTSVHVRGFLRNYARFLDLDPAPLLERYEASQNVRSSPVSTNSQTTISPETPLTTRNDQPFFNPVNVDLSGNTGGTESTVRLVIIAALLVTIALAASRFVPLLTGRGDGQNNLPQMIQSILEADDGAEVSSTTVPEGMTTPNGTVQSTVIPSSRNDPLGAATDEAVEAAGPPTRMSGPAVLDNIHLRLEITERTWLRVTIDGEVVLEDQVTREDGPFEWDAANEAHVLTGNAAGVFVILNDRDVGVMGERGEVVEQSWTTTSN